jgi:hypothetical protein
MIALSFSLMFRFRLVFLFVLLATVSTMHAQIRVELSISRRLYIAYEPIIATVTITNLAGRDIDLQDSPSQQWFGFQVLNGDDTPVPPRDVNYKTDPLTILAGQSVKRKVNLNELYPVNDFGLYRIRASIYFQDIQKYFNSPPSVIEVTDGRLIWQQTVGVPEGQQGAGGNRQISLLTFRLPKENKLYLRVEDKDEGVIYCMYQLGRVLVEEKPQIELDMQNQIHILQLSGPKAYLYSHVSLNGELLGQKMYDQLTSKPHMKKIANGTIAIAGGKEEAPPPAPGTTPTGPKLSDRPAGLPPGN